jgi:hypothetical protein
MIRIDLFRRRANHPERADRMAEPGGSSAFVSKREIIVGVVLLFVAFALLANQLYDPYDREPVAEDSYPVEPEVLQPQPPEQEPVAEMRPEPEGTPDPVEESPETTPVAVREPEPEQVELPRPAPPTSSEPASSVATLSKLDIAVADGAVEIRLRAGRELESSWFTLPDPSRVVIDLKDTDLQMEQRSQSIDHPTIKGLRIAQYQLDPMMVRMVIDVESRPEITITPQSDGLTIRAVPREKSQ